MSLESRVCDNLRCQLQELKGQKAELLRSSRKSGLTAAQIESLVAVRARAAQALADLGVCDIAIFGR
jgi:hypothetical protein